MVPGAGCLEEFRNQLVQSEVLVKRLIGCPLANVNATAFTKLYPAGPVQLAIGSADSVRMDAKTSGQFASAGEFLAGLQVATYYPQPNLRHQLLAQGNFAA